MAPDWEEQRRRIIGLGLNCFLEGTYPARHVGANFYDSIGLQLAEPVEFRDCTPQEVADTMLMRGDAITLLEHSFGAKRPDFSGTTARRRR